jgi:hypothetical protein
VTEAAGNSLDDRRKAGNLTKRLGHFTHVRAASDGGRSLPGPLLFRRTADKYTFLSSERGCDDKGDNATDVPAMDLFLPFRYYGI